MSQTERGKEDEAAVADEEPNSRNQFVFCGEELFIV